MIANTALLYLIDVRSHVKSNKFDVFLEKLNDQKVFNCSNYNFQEFTVRQNNPLKHFKGSLV